VNKLRNYKIGEQSLSVAASARFFKPLSSLATALRVAGSKVYLTTNL